MLSIFAVDTMKDSRDSHTLTRRQIEAHVQATAWLRPTHIAIDCFMDWPDQFHMWVNAIRRYKIPIIHRLKWWGWEFPEDGAVSSTEFTTKTKQFVEENITYFKDGDIFDVCAEMEVGPYWYKYGSDWRRFRNPACLEDFNTMLLTMFADMGSIFNRAALNIISNHCSHTPGTFINGVIRPEVAEAHHWITCDNYPDSNFTDPIRCTQALLDQFAELHNLYPNKKIFATEMGYRLQRVDDHTQQAVIAAELPALQTLPYLEGISYWVGCGYENHTDIIVREGGRWVPRPAARTIASFFANKGRIGRVPLS